MQSRPISWTFWWESGFWFLFSSWSDNVIHFLNLIWLAKVFLQFSTLFWKNFILKKPTCWWYFEMKTLKYGSNVLMLFISLMNFLRNHNRTLWPWLFQELFELGFRSWISFLFLRFRNLFDLDWNFPLLILVRRFRG